MPDFCMAPGCSNRGVPSGIQRHFHSVPKNERIQKMWLNNMKLKDPPRGPDGKLSKHCRVCSDHFTADSYKRDLQAELMGLTRPRKLKEDAVPTIFDFSGYSTATEKWHSILRHIVDKHEWTCAEIYTACDHAPLTREERRLKMWLKPGSASHKALQKIVLDKTLTKDLAQITEFRHTGDLEVFHNSMLKYMPKRVSFSYEGMVARTMLAALDNNTNVGREQAETLTGEKRWKLQWSKAAQDFVVKKISNPKDFTFRDDLMSSLVDRQRQQVAHEVDAIPVPALTKNTIAKTERPVKEDAVKRHLTRFNKNV